MLSAILSQRAPQFKIMKAKLNMEFKAARRKLEQRGASEPWKDQLEREYAQFKETIMEWQQLQMERMQLSKQKLAERLESEAALLAFRYRELELSLKMQHKRLAMLTAQVV